MNYITELNKFYRFCITKKHSKSEIALLHALYMINNAEDWSVWFEADNELISRLTGGLSRESINEARNKLKQKNRIDFKEGTRNVQSAKYMIISFEHKANEHKSDMKVDKTADIQADKGTGMKPHIPVGKEADVSVHTIIPKQKQTETETKQNKSISDSAASQAPRTQTTAKFTAPTAEQVAEYCLERRNGIDAEYFVDWYSSKGWKIGKEPMKDWKSAVRTWEKRNNYYDKQRGGMQNAGNDGYYGADTGKQPAGEQGSHAGKIKFKINEF